MSDLGFRVLDLGLGFMVLCVWKQIPSAIRPFRRYPKMHKTLALRSQNALPLAAPPS